jgi:hypothetical protein
VENFVRSEGPKGRWLITFLFGLIHGFGFASVLRDLGVASSTTGVTVPLVAFNPWGRNGADRDRRICSP